jgi:hypothetical protein
MRPRAGDRAHLTAPESHQAACSRLSGSWHHFAPSERGSPCRSRPADQRVPCVARPVVRSARRSGIWNGLRSPLAARDRAIRATGGRLRDLPTWYRSAVRARFGQPAERCSWAHVMARHRPPVRGLRILTLRAAGRLPPGSFPCSESVGRSAVAEAGARLSLDPPIGVGSWRSLGGERAVGAWCRTSRRLGASKLECSRWWRVSAW